MIFPSSNLGTCVLVGVVDSPDEPRELVIAPGDFLHSCRMKRRKHDQNDTRTTVNLFWVLLTSYRQSVCSFIGSRKQLRRTNLVPFFRTAVGCIASPRYASKLFLWTSPECFGFIPTFWVKRLSSCLLAVCQQCKTPSEIRLWSSGILKSQEICLSQQLWHFSAKEKFSINIYFGADIISGIQECDTHLSHFRKSSRNFRVPSDTG